MCTLGARAPPAAHAGLLTVALYPWLLLRLALLLLPAALLLLLLLLARVGGLDW